MHVLQFVNWSSVSWRFRGLMWIVAVVLASVIIIHLMPDTPSAHHAAARLMR
jgi:hypothetical protein